MFISDFARSGMSSFPVPGQEEKEEKNNSEVSEHGGCFRDSGMGSDFKVG